MYYCYGDSITKGSPGVSYLRYMQNRHSYVNLGLGGETLIGLIDRIDRRLKDTNVLDLIIQIGTNDILLPFLMRHSEKWIKQVGHIMNRGSLPCRDVYHFEETYTVFIKNLISLNKKMILINIPCIGEDTSSDVNKKVDLYNSVIHKLAADFGSGYVDFNGWQKSILDKNKKEDPYFISKEPFDIIMDVILTKAKPLRKSMSTKRDLVLTVDGCHLNDTGAKGLAALIESHIRQS